MLIRNKRLSIFLLACLYILVILLQIGCSNSGKIDKTEKSKSTVTNSQGNNKTSSASQNDTPSDTSVISSTDPANTNTNNNTPTPTATPKPDAPTVAFSKSAGLYDSAFNLSLSAPSGYTIYYTTDGSDPRVTGKQYSGEISIKKSDGNSVGPITKSFNTPISSQFVATVVRAYAKSGSNVTPISTQSYFISQSLSTKYNIPYISITLKASDFAAPTGIYHTVMAHPFDTKERKIAFCEFFESDGRKVDELYAELSMQGNGSLGAPQKSMRLYFKDQLDADSVNYNTKLKYDIFQGRAKDSKGNTITSFKRVLLRNSGNDFNASFLRDRLLQRVSAPLVVDYQESRPALIFIDGEFWGMYNVRERYDEKYFNDHYGIEEENFVMLEAPSPLKYNMDYNHPFELCEGVPGDEKAWESLISFASKNNLAVEANYQKVAEQLDVDNIIDMFVANIYMCNTDWPGNNIKVWRNKNAGDPSGMDTKWRFVLMDMDMGAGWNNNNASTNMMNHALDSNVIMSRLMKSLLNNQGFKTKFINRFNQVADEIYKSSLTVPVLDQMSNEIKAAIGFNIARWPNAGNSINNWNSEISKTRSFLQQRSSYAKQHLKSYFGI